MNHLPSVFIHNGILTIKNDSYKKEQIQEELQHLKAFRKGPYQINEVYIPSQWNSYIKWEYFIPIYKDYLKNKIKDLYKKNHLLKILDVGANNGYYSFLMYYQLKNDHLTSDFYLIDPTLDFYLQFEFLKKYFPKEDQTHWNYDRIGWQEIHLESFFDVIFCMGILYHHSDPYALLKKMHFLLKTGGVLILETITINHSDYPVCLVPEKKYAGSSGIWFIPNKKAVMNFLRRANFKEILFHNERFIVDEMKQNDYLPSLEENLSKDHTSTIEGYPIPYRSFFTAVK